MILSDRESRLALNRGQIILAPVPPEDAWSSTAVDLRLDAEIREWVVPAADTVTGQLPCLRPSAEEYRVQDVIRTHTIPKDLKSSPYLFHPGKFILGWTLEKLRLPHGSRICARVEGKSSSARIGLGVHVTAPTVHAGFGSGRDAEGDPLQLEIWNVGSFTIELQFGMPVCQLIFEEDTMWNRILHNETALMAQSRLQRRGMPMIVVPVRIDLKAQKALTAGLGAA